MDAGLSLAVEAHADVAQLNAPSASPLNATLAAFPSFTSILRRSIAQSAVRPTFKAIERARLASWLGVGAAGDDSVEDDEAELSALIGELGWTVDGEMIRIPTDPENDTKPISQQRDTIGLDSMLSRTTARADTLQSSGG